MTTRSWAWPSVLAAALLAAGLPGRAQPHDAAASDPPIKRGFEAAWARQPERQAAALRHQAADAAVQAAARWTPESPALQLSGRTDRPARDAGGREVEASIAVPLWRPGERAHAQAAARAEADAVQARLDALRWKVAEQVRAAYWDHARAALDRQLAQQRLQGAQALAADVTRRREAGDLARADSHQAEGAVAGAQAALSQAEAAAGKASRHWQALTGLPPPQGTPAAAEPSPPTHTLPPNHPVLAELVSRAETARRQRDLAGAQARANPELSVGAARERGAFGERTTQSVVVGLRLPLGRAAASASRIAAAGAEQLEAEASLAIEQQRLAAGVAAAQDQVRALQAASEAADRRAQLARESRGFVEKSFRLGESAWPARLRVELEAAEAEREAARARIEGFAAVSALRQALGLLPE